MLPVLVIYTGGTIGMLDSAWGLEPKPGLAQALLQRQWPQLPTQIEVVELDPLLDSSSMQPSHWMGLASRIIEQYERYHGFVIIQGTDTLAYTACALSFMLPGLQKTVAVTGAMVPMSVADSDAWSNVELSLLAACSTLNEVVVCFDGSIWSGSQVTKIDSAHRAAFSAPQAGPMTLNPTWLCPTQPLPLPRLRPVYAQPILTLTLHPGMDYRLWQPLLQMPPKALILRAFGQGNAPEISSFRTFLSQIDVQQTLVVVMSQCWVADVKLGCYASSALFTHIGAVSAATMTYEAVITKLLVLFSSQPDTSLEQIKQTFAQPWAREYATAFAQIT